jgi:hypothetical protein
MAIVLLKKKISMDGSPLRFKLHLMATTTGAPVHYVLTPAAHHDVAIVPELIETYHKNILILGDKGYVGLEKRLHKPQDYQLIIQARDNMTVQNTAIEKRFLGVFRKTIESTNALLDGQFNRSGEPYSVYSG